MSEVGVPLADDVDLTDAARSKCGSWLAWDGHRHLHNLGVTVDLWRGSLLP